MSPPGRPKDEYRSAQREGNPVSADAGSAQKRLLVVDDHAPSRRLACMIMGLQGWACDEASSGGKALAMLAARHYDCLLLDISMPQMSGEEVCLAIRRDPALASLRVVAFTAHAMPHERERIMAIGFDEIVTKPTTIAVLTAAIEGTPPA